MTQSDCCSARAQNVVWTRAGLLYFCGHHFLRHLPALKRRGYRMARLDDSGKVDQRIGW